jgi:hypothetical protein
MSLYVIERLPGDPLEAAAEFYRKDLQVLLNQLAEPSSADGDLLIVFPPASHEQCGWRLAAVQNLARHAVPRRVNGVVRDETADLAEVSRFLADAPGVTGQLFTMDGKSDRTR